MIFTRLTITHFGIYRGRNEFPLRPLWDGEETRPIVLIEGQNGAGKTTILEAVRLCLYGRGALGARVRRTDYEATIRQRIHRDNEATQQNKQTASIGLEFEHTHAGVRSTYDAVRSWQLEGNTLAETVSLFKDGQVFQDLAAEHWNDFLRDLIPPGVADLFFFDGEQIQALADETTSTSALETAIRGLLNLDLIERLRADLGVYLRQKQQQDQAKLEEQLLAAQHAYAIAEESCNASKQDLASLQARMDRTLDQIAKARQNLLREGASFVQHRDGIERRQKEVERELEEIHTAIRELANGLLPFAFTPAWCLRLAERLKQESTAEHTRIVATTQQTLVTQVRGALLDQQVQQETAPQVSPHDWVRIADRLQALLLSSDKEQEMSLRHPISAQDRLLLNQWIGIATQQIPQNLHALTVKIGRLEQEQSELAQALRQVPDATVASPLIETFNQLAEEKGRLQEQITLSKQTVKQAEINRAECERHIRKAEGQLAKAERLDQRVTMAAQTQLALDAYLAEMKAIKMDQLEGEVARYFNLLCRKQGLVHEVHIDPQDYTVMLYGSNRTPIATSELSAGEKQLYAMSLLWALRSVSGRAFPIIVDTPMGRLDSEHRHALLTTFFPHAAHQVIMLATDTEVDTAAYATLQPAIAHRYQLVFDHERACTAVQYARGTQPEQPTEEAA